jgi:hypothetical protein
LPVLVLLTLAGLISGCGGSSMPTYNGAAVNTGSSSDYYGGYDAWGYYGAGAYSPWGYYGNPYHGGGAIIVTPGYRPIARPR